MGTETEPEAPAIPGPLVLPADEFAALRTALEHAQAALAGDNEGVRLWMLDCGGLVANAPCPRGGSRGEARCRRRLLP